MKLFGWTLSRDVQDGIRIVGELQRVPLEDGDLLVLLAPNYMPREQREDLKHRIVALPCLKERNIQVVLLEGGIKVGVLGSGKPKAP